jgi:hypothetical protein
MPFGMFLLAASWSLMLLLVLKYDECNSWKDATILPFANLEDRPADLVGCSSSFRTFTTASLFALIIAISP